MELSAEQKEYLESLNGDVAEAYKAGADFMRYELEQKLYFSLKEFVPFCMEPLKHGKTLSFEDMVGKLNDFAYRL